MASSQASFLGRAKKSFWIFLGSVLVFIGAIFLLIARTDLVQEQRFKKEAQRVPGVILSKDILKATKNRRTQYRYTYSFTPLEGQQATGSDSVDVETSETLQPGNTIEVEYLPADPSHNRIAKARNLAALLIGAVLGATLTTVGGFLFIKAILKIRLELRILRERMPAEATVTAVQQTSVRINGRRQWMIRYSYRDHLGQTHEGKSGYVPRFEAVGWHKGDRGRVHFNGQRPEQSIWIDALEKVE